MFFPVQRRQWINIETIIQQDNIIISSCVLEHHDSFCSRTIVSTYMKTQETWIWACYCCSLIIEFTHFLFVFSFLLLSGFGLEKDYLDSNIPFHNI